MSHLTPQEVEAGASRRALATFKRIHGMLGKAESPNGNGHKSEIPAVNVAKIISDGTEEHCVIATPYRRLSILDGPGHIIVRDACFVGSKCDVALIHVEREQLRLLGKLMLAIADQDEVNA